MTTNVIAANRAEQPQQKRQSAPRWHTLLAWGIVLAVVLIAIAMRAYNLNKPFDYDGYDEGVYWQSLRAMSAGYMLYGQVFYSQPPFFLLSIYPFYMLLGQTIWAARIGIASIALLGLPGAYLLGKALAGRVGGIAAMILLIVTPVFAAESQILQAEAPATALLLLTIGSAFMWWKYPAGRKGMALALLCGITLALGILTKLLDILAIVPIVLLVLARLWLLRQRNDYNTRRVVIPIIIAIAAGLIVTIVVLAPFFGIFQALFQQVVTYHNAAKAAMIAGEAGNVHTLINFVLSNIVLCAAGALGAIVALLRRDWRAIPLIAWALVTFIVLLVQVPLFPRHAIALVPPAIGAAVLGLDNLPSLNELRTRIPTAKLATSALCLLVMLAVVASIPQDYAHYRALSAQAESGSTRQGIQIAHDLQQVTTPDQWVITDGQYVLGLADRSVPPALVDTSMVRIDSGYLALQQLVQGASNPRVHAILFMTGRLALVAGFHAWVAQHFHLLHKYGPEIELWVR